MNLEENRRKENEIERNQIKLVSQFFEQRRKKFDYADIAHWALENQKEIDLIYISESLTDWHQKAKESSKKQFLDMILAVFRIQSYCNAIETISKASVANYANECVRTKKLESELSNLKLELMNTSTKYEQEIKSLKSEIEFISSGNR